MSSVVASGICVDQWWEPSGTWMECRWNVSGCKWNKFGTMVKTKCNLNGL
jgi:hypothetical protein